MDNLPNANASDAFFPIEIPLDDDPANVDEREPNVALLRAAESEEQAIAQRLGLSMEEARAGNRNPKSEEHDLANKFADENWEILAEFSSPLIDHSYHLICDATTYAVVNYTKAQGWYNGSYLPSRTDAVRVFLGRVRQALNPKF